MKNVLYSFRLRTKNNNNNFLVYITDLSNNITYQHQKTSSVNKQYIITNIKSSFKLKTVI